MVEDILRKRRVRLLGGKMSKIEMMKQEIKEAIENYLHRGWLLNQVDLIFDKYLYKTSKRSEVDDG